MRFLHAYHIGWSYDDALQYLHHQQQQQQQQQQQPPSLNSKGRILSKRHHYDGSPLSMESYS